MCYKYHMKIIAVRELRQQASRYLREVERGGTSEVSDRGRAVARPGPPAIGRARQLIDRLELVRIDDALLDAAALLPVEDLHSLDAIHLAAAQRLGSDLSVLVSYDERMLSAARALGIRVTSPR